MTSTMMTKRGTIFMLAIIMFLTNILAGRLQRVDRQDFIQLVERELSSLVPIATKNVRKALLALDRSADKIVTTLVARYHLHFLSLLCLFHLSMTLNKAIWLVQVQVHLLVLTLEKVCTKILNIVTSRKLSQEDQAHLFLPRRNHTNGMMNGIHYAPNITIALVAVFAPQTVHTV